MTRGSEHFEAIRTIKTVSAAKKVFEAIMPRATAAGYNDLDWRTYHGVNFKFGGTAWYKDRILAACNSIAHKASVRSFRSEASPESKAWDSFEGGNAGVYTDRAAADAIENELAKFILETAGA